jgi:hypothetical protein
MKHCRSSKSSLVKYLNSRAAAAAAAAAAARTE